MSTPRPRRASILSLALAGATISSCSPLILSSAPASIEIHSNQASLTPDWLTAVYTSPDQNTADVYLSDLPIDLLTAEDPAALDAHAGNIVHLHYFLTPKAGRTPIDANAANVTIQHLVLVPNPQGGLGFAGLYGGGGFLLPTDEPGSRTFSGRIREGSHRLLRAGPGFTDRLGHAVIEGAIAARKDDGACAAIARNLSLLKRERLDQ